MSGASSDDSSKQSGRDRNRVRRRRRHGNSTEENTRSRDSDEEHVNAYSTDVKNNLDDDEPSVREASESPEPSLVDDDAKLETLGGDDDIVPELPGPFNNDRGYSSDSTMATMAITQSHR